MTILDSKMASLNYYWKRTATELTWTIAFRETTNCILDESKIPFTIKKENPGFWGADPFLYEWRGEIYLFYELFINKKSKGVIAVSKYSHGKFTSPQIIIEEPYHMSFPCIFESKGKLFMIPETGMVDTMFLYECISFPYQWKRVKVLLENIKTSDTIVYRDKDGLWVLASILKGNACYSYNMLYRYDETLQNLTLCCQQKEEGERGFRNAGYIFKYGNILVRPGQNCEDRQYGKSLYFWRVDNIAKEKYSETFLKEITVDDVALESTNTYSGIHTYNRVGNIEVIDLKEIKKRHVLKHVGAFLKIIRDYVLYNVLKR